MAAPSSASVHRHSRSDSLSRGLIATLCLILLGSVSVGCSDGAHDQSRSAAPSDQEVSLLFSLVAPNLSITSEGDGYRLALPASSPVSWFTDRPERNAGTLDGAGFASLWAAEDFYDDPPNAAVVVTVGEVTQQYVVELTDARVTGETVSFHATEIGDGGGDVVQAGGRSTTHPISVGSFGASELFIDNASTPPCASSITAYSNRKCLLTPNQSVTFSMKPPYRGGCIDTLQSASGQTTLVTYITVLPKYDPVWLTINDSQPTFCFEYPSGATWIVQNGANPSLFGYDYPDVTGGGERDY